MKKADWYWIIGGIVFIILLLGASGENTTVSNDWDADGDAFDSEDYNKFIEYKNSQEYDILSY
jgi:hypothetical protein